jgi:hypothetical protein
VKVAQTEQLEGNMKYFVEVKLLTEKVRLFSIGVRQATS